MSNQTHFAKVKIDNHLNPPTNIPMQIQATQYTDTSHVALLFGDVELTNYADCSAFDFVSALHKLAEAVLQELEVYDSARVSTLINPQPTENHND